MITSQRREELYTCSALSHFLFFLLWIARLSLMTTQLCIMSAANIHILLMTISRRLRQYHRCNSERNHQT